MEDIQDVDAPPLLRATSVRDIKLQRETGMMSWDRYIFWNGSRPWLARRGYRLYEFDTHPSVKCSPEWLPSKDSASIFLPYVDHSWPTQEYEDAMSPGALLSSFLVCAGQDSYKREVVLKITDRGSNEYTIYEFLSKLPEPYDPATFPGVLPSVDILDHPDGFSYIVMPRWDDAVFHRPLIRTAAEVVYSIRSLLQGLTFLHAHRIAHGDISPDNFLLNYPVNAQFSSDTRSRKGRHRASPYVQYCLFDFDVSRLYPPQSSLRERFAPSAPVLGLGKWWFQPDDFCQGEPRYNPFLFDVACMGIVFRKTLWHCVPVIPKLVPLFDRMSTDYLLARFTAAEALQFISDIISGMPDEDLLAEVPEYDHSRMPSMEELWNTLPTSFATDWAAYRSPPLPWSARILRFVARNFKFRDYHFGEAFLITVRRILDV